MIKRLINQFRLWKCELEIEKYRRYIRSLEQSVMNFEIPSDLAISKIEWYEQQILELESQNQTRKGNF